MPKRLSPRTCRARSASSICSFVDADGIWRNPNDVRRRTHQDGYGRDRGLGALPRHKPCPRRPARAPPPPWVPSLSCCAPKCASRHGQKGDRTARESTLAREAPEARNEPLDRRCHPSKMSTMKKSFKRCDSTLKTIPPGERNHPSSAHLCENWK